jgi:hypothetical protein
MQFTSYELYMLINSRPINGPLWLANADLSEANLGGAKCNNDTTWPDGFVNIRP